MTVNPFTFGNPIKDPARFIGRQAEIRQISGRLLSSAHESTSLVGAGPMGQTSLPSHLAGPPVHQGVSVIPAPGRELVSLCHPDEIRGSRFFNSFANVGLRPFPRADA